MIVMTHGRRAIATRSQREPGALVVCVESCHLARNGVMVKTSRSVLIFIVAVAAHPGAIVSSAELQDVLFAGRADGGTDDAPGSLSTLAFRAVPALAALGYRLETNHRRGRYVRCCINPNPVTYGDLAAASELSHGQA